jgi:Prenyltransferase and squalene oxidase repeat
MRRYNSPLLLLLLAVPAWAAPEESPRAKEVDAAVRKALNFLKSNQSKDGTWPSPNRAKAAVTGLAVMAFLSSGHIPGEGPYGPTVEKGIKAVLKMQAPSGLIATDGSHEMYHHGICTLMLAEVAGMTQGKLAEEVKKALEKAVGIILQAQRKGDRNSYRGGWRYRLQGNDADMSVTGWQLLALRASKNLGCDVPGERIDRAVDYIKRSKHPSGGFCYTPHGGVTVPCTGTAILGLEVCARRNGKEEHPPEAVTGGNYLIRNPPSWGRGPFFFYAIYYCSQASFQLGGNYWKVFRDHLHNTLLKRQSSTGSWQDPDGYGPNYATAMAILALTVEYRFLPIYQRGEEPSDRSGK